MKKMYLLRHGQTIFNLKLKMQGHCDSPLTNKGIKQAESIRDYFIENNIDFDAVYSSSSERAIDTARIVSENKYPILPSKDLREMNFGDLEGENGHLELTDLTQDKDYLVKFHGEDQISAQKRMYSKITEIMESINDSVLVVSSSCSIMNFVKYVDLVAYQKLMSEVRFINCTLLIFEYENGNYRLVDIKQPPEIPND